MSSRFSGLLKTAEATENKDISRVLLAERKACLNPPGPDRPQFHRIRWRGLPGVLQPCPRRRAVRHSCGLPVAVPVTMVDVHCALTG